MRSYLYFSIPAIIVYPILALVLPVVFHAVKRKFIWWSIAVAVVLDLILYLPEFLYYESRGLFIVFTLAQIAVMAVVISVLKWIGGKRIKKRRPVAKK